MKKVVKKTNASKALEKENRRIDKDNKAFEKMSPAEKRVQIARDVLAQLASKRLIAESGTWLLPKKGNSLFSKSELKENAELQTVLGKKKECTGCALGGMFMCAVERADKLKLKDLSEASQEEAVLDEEDIFKYMKKYFSQEQLNKIESAFERGEGACYDYEAESWLRDVEDASTRMRLIMENIVVNKGKFTLSKAPKEVISYVTPGFNG